MGYLSTVLHGNCFGMFNFFGAHISLKMRSIFAIKRFTELWFSFPNDCVNNVLFTISTHLVNIATVLEMLAIRSTRKGVTKRLSA